MKYFLSNRQVKELVGRAAPIMLALPVPPGPQRDWPTWARSVLPPEVATYVQRAAEERVLIRPAIGVDLDNLTALLGPIVRESDARQFEYTTMAIVVDLCVPHPRNPGSGKLQWPMDVSIDGQRLFPPEVAT